MNVAQSQIKRRFAAVLIAGVAAAAAAGCWGGRDAATQPPINVATPSALAEIRRIEADEIKPRLAALEVLRTTEISVKERQLQTLSDLIKTMQEQRTQPGNAQTNALSELAQMLTAGDLVALVQQIEQLRTELESLYRREQQLENELRIAAQALEEHRQLQPLASALLDLVEDAVDQGPESNIVDLMPTPVLPGGSAVPATALPQGVPTPDSGTFASPGTPGTNEPTATPTPDGPTPEEILAALSPTPDPAVPTPTGAPEPELSPTPDPTAGPTAEPSATPGASPTAAATATPVEGTGSPAPSPSASPSPEASPAATATPSGSPAPTATPTPSGGQSPAPTATPMPTATPVMSIPVEFETNLIQNGGGESGTPAPNPSTVVGASYWTTTGPLTTLQYRHDLYGYPTPDSPGSPDRGQNYFAGGPAGGAGGTIATQSINVSAIADKIDDVYVIFELGGYFGGSLTEPDTAGMGITFFNQYGIVVGKTSIGPVSANERANTTGMQPRFTADYVPATTRHIEIELRMEGGDGYINGFADDLSLVLRDMTP